MSKNNEDDLTQSEIFATSAVVTCLAVFGVFYFESWLFIGLSMFMIAVGLAGMFGRDDDLQPIPEGLKNRTTKALKSLKSSTEGVYVDTETSGLDWNDEIIEIAVISESGEVLMNNLVKPTSRVVISKEATSVHGITHRMLKNAATWEELYPEFIRHLGDKVVRTYNAEFDKRLIMQTCKAWELPKPKNEFLCIMKAYATHAGHYKNKARHYKWWKLETITGRIYTDCRVKGKRHRALTDCKEAYAVTQKMRQSI